ncbi:MAG: TetR/AcrR family transcriptional regulator [Coriobacteriales bacterium]
MVRKKKAVAAMRKRIMDAYWQAYAKDPTRRVTASAVVEGAQCNRSTFYEYFGTADDVLKAIEKEVAGKIADSLAESYEREGTLEAIAETMTDTYSKEGDRALVLLGPHGDPSFQRLLKETIRPVLERDFEVHFDTAEQRRAFDFAFGGLLGILVSWDSAGREMPLGDVVRLAQRFLLFGVATQTTGWEDSPAISSFSEQAKRKNRNIGS